MLPIPEDVLAWHAEARALAKKVVERVVNEHVHRSVRAELERGKLVAILGGDHSAPYGAIRAVAEAHPGVGILHVDAHADLREAYEGFEHSHASIMHNVMKDLPGVARLVQVGIRDLSEAEHAAIRDSGGRIVTFFDHEIAARRFDGEAWRAQTARMIEPLPQTVYVSFDVDGLDPTLCPHTGTPVPGGLSFQEATALVAAVARSGRKIVGVDLNEVVPGPEGDEWDGNVGARLLYKMIGWMLVSQSPRAPSMRPPSL
jgi:agmatinase